MLLLNAHAQNNPTFGPLYADRLLGCCSVDSYAGHFGTTMGYMVHSLGNCIYYIVDLFLTTCLIE